MFKENNTKYPRILVISNNPFSDTTNNGKTLASFFRDFPPENIFQLYFSPEAPDNEYYRNYFRISDNDIIKSVFNKNMTCGGIIESKTLEKAEMIKNNKSNCIKKLKNYNITRIARELVWASKKWNTELLNHWLEEISPQLVFFCAGDSGFAYDITKYIQEKTGTKLIMYITDDYVLPRKTLSPFWWFRRNYILNKMRDAVQRSDLFLTISQKMREEYKKIFGKDSIVAVNMTESIKDETVRMKSKDILTLVYAGGLHYNRYKTLNLLAEALKRYNHEFGNKRKAYLKIYSEQIPTKKVLKYLNVEGGSEFCGRLNPKQLKEVLNSCDIPVHVESFDRKSIESTRLSISTKIPEYLSLGKPVLAIGPEQVASLEYLKDCAFCITDPENIYSNLKKLFSNCELLKELSSKALFKYNKNHKKEKVSKELIFNIISLSKK